MPGVAHRCSQHPPPAPNLLDALAVGLPGADQEPLRILDVGAQALPRPPRALRRVQAELGLQAHKCVDAQREQRAARERGPRGGR